jgi:hypothetical protein
MLVVAAELAVVPYYVSGYVGILHFMLMAWGM